VKAFVQTGEMQRQPYLSARSESGEVFPEAKARDSLGAQLRSKGSEFWGIFESFCHIVSG
jgi:hypothetical protein